VLVERIIGYISVFLALMIVLPVHEFAHGFAAVKSGDPTPKLYGRYTINPLAHFDLIGLACFVFAGFGWAKPVPINPTNFRNYKRGCFFTSIAGVLANYVLAFFAFPLFALALKYLPFGNVFDLYLTVLVDTLYYIFSLSLTFFVFNIIPIYPLDGFRIIDVFSKRRSSLYWFLRNKGIYVLYGLFFLSILADFTGLVYLDVLGYTISKAVGIIEKPILWAWGWII